MKHAPPSVIFWALPYNRIVNLWFPQYAQSFSASVEHPLPYIHQFRFSTFLETSYVHFRMGFASQKALDIINAHPFLAVGDVPGSFAFSLHEHGAFEEGRYYPLPSATKLHIPAFENTATHIYMTVNLQLRTIDFSGKLNEGYSFGFVTHIPSTEAMDVPFFPVFSLASELLFRFQRL